MRLKCPYYYACCLFAIDPKKLVLVLSLRDLLLLSTTTPMLQCTEAYKLKSVISFDDALIKL